MRTHRDELRAILVSGAGAWNGWRQQNPAASPDLSGLELPRLQLSDFDLTGCNFSGCNLEETDLTAAQLSRSSLAGANLRCARLANACLDDSELMHIDLAGATLVGTRLRHANALQANLKHSDLSGADLTGAFLRQADLTAANLSRANLARTNLTGAELRDANLADATVAETMLFGVDLRYVKNLDGVRRGPDPEGVHQGGSLDDAGPRTEHRCVLSYSRDDASVVDGVYSALNDRGIACWRDTLDLPAGSAIIEELVAAIHKTKKVVLCCSKASMSSWWVKTEIDIALDLERRMNGKKVLIPVDLDDHLGGGDEPHCVVLRTRNCLSLRAGLGDNGLEHLYDQIADAVRS